MSTNKWFPGLRRRPEARLQLFCFSYAGGGASAFRGWQDQLPPWIEVWALEYPGRETRFRDPAFGDAVSLSNAIGAELAAAINLPCAFFGHSMGALLAFETARNLRRLNGKQPLQLFVSGHGAPHLPPFRPAIRNLPEREFREELRLYGGTPNEVLANDDLMQFLSPLLRRDLGICETYGHRVEPELNFPIVAFGGTDDPTVPLHRLLDWSFQTSAGFRAYLIPGDHFFVRKAAGLVWKVLAQSLEHGEALGPIRAPAAEEVHLWRIPLEVPDEMALRLRPLLSADEVQRADAYLHAADRTRYTVTRAALRTLLGQYGNVAPEKLQFAYASHGKPSCPELLPLEFNVAHSGSLALIAIGRGQALGVDIERVKPGLDWDGIGRQVFTQVELNELARRPSHQQMGEFFDLWVRKEAYLKCTGDGFLGSPEKVHIGLRTTADQTGSAALHGNSPGRGPCVQSFSPALGYAAALAVEKSWQWTNVFNWQIDDSR